MSLMIRLNDGNWYTKAEILTELDRLKAENERLREKARAVVKEYDTAQAELDAADKVTHTEIVAFLSGFLHYVSRNTKDGTPSVPRYVFPEELQLLTQESITAGILAARKVRQS